MQFDVIIGNPPYQLDDGGYGTSAAPDLPAVRGAGDRPRPALRCHGHPVALVGGRQGTRRVSRARCSPTSACANIVDYPKLYEAFPGVKIRRRHLATSCGIATTTGRATIQTIWDGEPTGPAVARYLDEYDILVRRNEAVSILREGAGRRASRRFDARVSSRQAVRPADELPRAGRREGIKIPSSSSARRRSHGLIARRSPTNAEWIDEWKVLMTARPGHERCAVETKFLSKPIIAGPGTACTETYLVAGRFDTEAEATSYASVPPHAVRSLPRVAAQVTQDATKRRLRLRA